MKTQIYKKFTFEAAHRLINNSLLTGNKYSNIHGHSFQVEVYITDNVSKEKGWIADFSYIDKILEPIKKQLDHNFLNNIDGLSNPTLENIAQWIWDKTIISLPQVNKIIIKRGNCGEGCVLEK